MYQLTIHNSTNAPMTAGDGTTIEPNASWTSGELGDTYIHSEALGSISFCDIGDKHIGGDSGETWGVLISYQGSHMVGRYEGGGTLKVTFNDYLQAIATGMDLRLVQLDPLVPDGAVAS